jgi:SPP1 family predicted phage head-tail adaptor
MSGTNVNINPGAYRHKIKIQYKSFLNDGEGIPSDTWTDLITTYASFEPMNGLKYFNAEASTVIINAVFKIRYSKNIQIDSTMRVSYMGKNYNIKYLIDTDGLHRELQLACMEEIQNG